MIDVCLEGPPVIWRQEMTAFHPQELLRNVSRISLRCLVKADSKSESLHCWAAGAAGPVHTLDGLGRLAMHMTTGLSAPG